MSYDIIKRNYARGMWSVSMVKLAVRKGVITPSQFEKITGEVYL